MLYLELYFHHTLAIKCTLYIFTQNGHDSCSVLQGMLKRLLKQVTLRHLLNTNYSVFPPFYVFRGQQFTTTMQIKCLGLNKKKKHLSVVLYLLWDSIQPVWHNRTVQADNTGVNCRHPWHPVPLWATYYTGSVPVHLHMHISLSVRGWLELLNLLRKKYVKAPRHLALTDKISETTSTVIKLAEFTFSRFWAVCVRRR